MSNLMSWKVREALWDRAETLDMQAEDMNSSQVWLVGDRCSLADLSYLTWSRTAYRLGIDLEAEFPEVHSWRKCILWNKFAHLLIGVVENMMKRPGVIEGLRANVDV